MYSTCLHCHKPLGSNESIEAFPVGKRLAFDAKKGRLWVVCPSCGRWNLTPLEERWEAVEDCERQFRGARQRVSSGEIGLVRLQSGLHLVRIGAPPTNEMAAWRYGRELRSRWLKRGLPSAAIGMGFLGMQGVIYDNPGSIAVGFTAVVGLAGLASLMSRRNGARLILPDGRVATVNPVRYGTALLRPHPTEGWALHYDYQKRAALLHGTPATHTLRNLLTTVNYNGAVKRDVDSAAALLSEFATPGDFIRKLARAGERTRITSLAHYPTAIRSALEMALHDDAERRAMEGELEGLKTEWLLAEEIARIADDMLLPAEVNARLHAMGEGVT